jgi:hypothetical protein
MVPRKYHASKVCSTASNKTMAAPGICRDVPVAYEYKTRSAVSTRFRRYTEADVALNGGVAELAELIGSANVDVKTLLVRSRAGDVVERLGQNDGRTLKRKMSALFRLLNRRMASPRTCLGSGIVRDGHRQLV